MKVNSDLELESLDWLYVGEALVAFLLPILIDQILQWIGAGQPIDWKALLTLSVTSLLVWLRRQVKEWDGVDRRKPTPPVK